jgi:hypothetical protein
MSKQRARYVSKLKFLGCGTALKRFRRFHGAMKHRFAHLDAQGKLEQSKYWTPDAQFILMKNSSYGGDVAYFCGQGALALYR